MNDLILWASVGLNLGAATVNTIASARYRARLKELANGYRQDRKNLGSATGAVSAGSPGERTGGAVVPAPAGPCTCPEPVSEEIIAWRGWRWVAEPDAFGGWDLSLHGFHGTRWDGPVLVADQTPEVGNPNGIYARPMDWYAQIMAQRFFVPHGGNCSPVQGLVALSGRVLQGDHGWRAERATVRELWVIGEPPVPKLLVQSVLEDRYKCDIHWGEIPESIFPGWHYA